LLRAQISARSPQSTQSLRYFFLYKQDGAIRDIIWPKDSPATPLRFFTSDGQEVQFNASQLWIVALPAIGNVAVN